MVEEEVKGKKLDNEIFEHVVKKLENKNDWESYSEDSIHHKTENIRINYDMDYFGIEHILKEPEHIKCPSKYNKQIQKLIRNILSFNSNAKKIFALDYVSGKYGGYIDMDNFPHAYKDEFKEWLHTEVTEENYVIKTHSFQNETVYFKRKADHAFMVLKWL